MKGALNLPIFGIPSFRIPAFGIPDFGIPDLGNLCLRESPNVGFSLPSESLFSESLFSESLTSESLVSESLTSESRVSEFPPSEFQSNSGTPSSDTPQTPFLQRFSFTAFFSGLVWPESLRFFLLRAGNNNKLNFLWPNMARLGPRLEPKNSPPKSLCGSLFLRSFPGNEKNQLSFLLWGGGGKKEMGRFGWGKKFMSKKFKCFFHPLFVGLSTTKTLQTVTLQVTILCQQISKEKQHAPEHSFALTLHRSFLTIFWQQNLTKLPLAVLPFAVF